MEGTKYLALQMLTVDPLAQSSLVWYRLKDDDNGGEDTVSKHRWTDGIALADLYHLGHDGKEGAAVEGTKYLTLGMLTVGPLSQS